MKKRFAIFATLAIFAVIGAADSYGQEKFSKVVTDASRWDAINYEAPEECSGDAQECAIKMLKELKINIGDEPEFSVYQLGEVDQKNVTVVFVSHLVEDDDSVLGMLYRLEMARGDVEDKSFSLDGLGRLYQCMEGEAGWRKTVCQ